MDTFQNVEKEILEMKMMFTAKDQEMAKMQAKMDYQHAKIERMEQEIENLKNSKSEVENKLKTMIHQQEGEIRSLKQNTKQLLTRVSNLEMTLNAMHGQSQGQIKDKGTSRQRSGKGAIRKRFPLQKPRWEKTKLTIRYLYHETYRKPNEQLFSQIDYLFDNSGEENVAFANNQIIKMKNDNEILSEEEEKQLIRPKTIDNSTTKSRMTKRQVVGGIAFSAYLSHNIPHLAVGHTIKCDQIIINDGNAYSKFTGAFTVPETGVYLITFTFDVYDHARYEGIQLVVNNRNIVDAIAEGNNDKHAMGGNTVILQLTQGEKVWLESYYSSDGEIVSSTTSKLTTFSGVLLYSWVWISKFL